MMAFLVTMPISMRMPITTGRLIGIDGQHERDDGAADRQRQREQDGDRLQEAAEQQHQHGIDHHQAGAHGLGEALEHLAHDLGVAELLELDAGGQASAAGSAITFSTASPSAAPPTRSAPMTDAAHAVVAVDRGRALAELEARHRRQRHGGAGRGRHLAAPPGSAGRCAPAPRAARGSAPAGRRRRTWRGWRRCRRWWRCARPRRWPRWRRRARRRRSVIGHHPQLRPVELGGRHDDWPAAAGAWPRSSARRRRASTAPPSRPTHDQLELALAVVLQEPEADVGHARRGRGRSRPRPRAWGSLRCSLGTRLMTSVALRTSSPEPSMRPPLTNTLFTSGRSHDAGRCARSRRACPRARARRQLDGEQQAPGVLRRQEARGQEIEAADRGGEDHRGRAPRS